METPSRWAATSRPYCERLPFCRFWRSHSATSLGLGRPAPVGQHFLGGEFAEAGPDLLSTLVVSARFVRPFVMKAAHAAVSGARSRKSGWGGACGMSFSGLRMPAATDGGRLQGRVNAQPGESSWMRPEGAA